MARLILRADGDAARGVGHLMRCLTIAEELAALGHQRVLATRACPPSIAAQYQALGGQVVPLADDDPATLAAVAQGGAILLDGYGFDAGYQQALGGCPLAVIDDRAAGEIHADLIINPNAGATVARYAGLAGGAAILAGPAHALIRREFRDCALLERGGRVMRALVSLGGSDPANGTETVLKAFERLPEELEVDVVLGAANGFADAIAACARTLAHTVTLTQGASDMAARMAKADLAVIAGGVTALEAAYMGLPALILGIADNQILPVKALAAAGTARWLDARKGLAPESVRGVLRALIDDAALRRSMADAGRRLVDGRGAARVAAALADLMAGRPIADPSL